MPGGHGHSQQNALTRPATEISSRERADLAMENYQRLLRISENALETTRRRLIEVEELLGQVLESGAAVVLDANPLNTLNPEASTSGAEPQL